MCSTGRRSNVPFRSLEDDGVPYVLLHMLHPEIESTLSIVVAENSSQSLAEAVTSLAVLARWHLSLLKNFYQSVCVSSTYLQEGIYTILLSCRSRHSSLLRVILMGLNQDFCLLFPWQPWIPAVGRYEDVRILCHRCAEWPAHWHDASPMTASKFAQLHDSAPVDAL